MPPQPVWETLIALVEAIQSLVTQLNVVVQPDVQVICCDTIPPYYPDPVTTIVVYDGDPPDPYADWDEYDADRCARTWSVIDAIELAWFELMDKADVVSGGLTLGLVALILADVLAPWMIIVEVAALVLTAFVGLTIPDEKTAWTNARFDMMCAIMTATTAADAKIQVDAVLDASDITAAAAYIAKLAWNINAINGIFDQTFTINPLSSTDCDGCETPGALLETAHSSPYNVTLVGTFESSSGQDNEAQGYSAFGGSGGVDAIWTFTAPANIQFIDMHWEQGWITTPDELIYTGLEIRRVDDPFTLVFNSGDQAYSFVTPNFVQKDILSQEVNLLAGVTYRVQFRCDSFNRYAFFRDILFEASA